MAQRIESVSRSEQMWIIALSITAIVGSFALQPTMDGKIRLPISIAGVGTELPDGCLFKITTGLPCPGCGLTRSFVHLAHGRFLLASELNLMGPLLYIICVFQIPYRLIEYTGVCRSNATWQKLKLSLGPLTWCIIGGLFVAWMIKLAWLVVS